MKRFCGWNGREFSIRSTSNTPKSPTSYSGSYIRYPTTPPTPTLAARGRVAGGKTLSRRLLNLLLWTSSSNLKLRLHTAINRADFVSWSMLYTYEGNKMHSRENHDAVLSLGQPLNHIHQETKSVRLIAVCKRGLTFLIPSVHVFSPDCGSVLLVRTLVHNFPTRIGHVLRRWLLSREQCLPIN